MEIWKYRKNKICYLKNKNMYSIYLYRIYLPTGEEILNFQKNIFNTPLPLSSQNQITVTEQYTFVI